jgi:hypothetical protein
VSSATARHGKTSDRASPAGCTAASLADGTVRVVAGGTSSDTDRAERKRRMARIRQYLAGPDRYGAVLIILLGIFVMLGLSHDGRWLRLVLVPLLAVTLEFILSTSGASKQVRRASWTIDSTVMVIAIVQVVVFHRQQPYATYLACSALTVTGMYFVFRRILEHAVISTQTLFAAASMYVLIGLSFAFVLLSISMIVGPDFLNGAEREPSDYVYASFITMTTVGYGDIVPRANSARVIMSLEALIGQLFLATVIARLVSGFGRTRRDLGDSQTAEPS